MGRSLLLPIEACLEIQSQILQVESGAKIHLKVLTVVLVLKLTKSHHKLLFLKGGSFAVYAFRGVLNCQKTGRQKIHFTSKSLWCSTCLWSVMLGKPPAYGGGKELT